MRIPRSMPTRHAFTFLLLTCAAVPAAAQPSKQVLIHAAAANAEQTVLFVEGTNFSSNAAVYLAGVPLGGVMVNATGTALTAVITGTLPGTYQLHVSNGPATPQNARFEVALGNSGARGGPGTTRGNRADRTARSARVAGPSGSRPVGGVCGAEGADYGSVNSREEGLETLLAGVSRSGNDIFIDGANLHIRDGSGSTDGPVNGLGNLIVGYNERRGEGDDRTGSHNLIVGSQHNYSAYSSLVASSATP